MTHPTTDAGTQEVWPETEGGYPRICVVMPVYRAVETVEAALKSVLDQNYPNLEIAAAYRSDDVETVALLRSLDIPELTLIEQSDRGIANARNAILSTVKADFFLFLDSDDVLIEGTIADYVKASAHHPQAGLFYSDWIGLVPGGRKVLKYTFFIQPRALRAFCLLAENFVATSSTFIRYDVYEKVGLFNENYSHAEDWEYWMRVHDNFAFHKVDRFSLVYSHTKLNTLRSRDFWLQEITIINKRQASPISKLFARSMAYGRYALYVIRTRSLRPSRQDWDAFLIDYLCLPIALSEKLTKRIVYKAFIKPFM